MVAMRFTFYVLRFFTMTNKRPKVGLALSGGAARGLAHVGVLGVLVNAGIPIDYVAGTSAGSIIGAVYCAGMNMDDIRLSVDIMGWTNVAKPTLSLDGFFSFEKIESWLKFMIGDLRFCDLQTPLTIVTTDLDTGKPVFLRKGRVAEAVRASCSIPGFVTPKIINGKRLVDGGISDNLPLDAVKEMGAEYIIGVDVMEPYLKPNLGPLAPGFLSLITMIQRSGGNPELADCLIQPHATKLRSLVDFSKKEEAILAGEVAAKEKIGTLQTALNLD
jgi:NTE family protein